MSELNRYPQSPEIITGAGSIRSRFDMFVVLKPQAVSRYPKRSLAWCHRGDKYTDDPDKMLCNLLKMFINHYKQYQLVELYDNTRPKNDPERIIMKLKDGVIEINRLLPLYSPMLTKIYLPEYLKPSQP